MAESRSLAFMGFPGYEIDTDGLVWSSKSGKRKPLALTRLNGEEYLACQLWKNNRSRTFQVHRLVLLAFVGPCPKGMECRHFPDRNPANNRLENLSWATHQENEADKETHGTRTRLCGAVNPRARFTEEMVREIRRQYKDGEFDMNEIARKLGCSQMAIWSIVRRKTWKHVS